MTKTALISVFLNTWGNYNENGTECDFDFDLIQEVEEDA